MTTNALEPVSVLGVQVHPFTVPSLHHCIESIIVAKDRAIVANVNVHALNLSVDDPAFRNILNDAAYVFCDGFGVRLGARLLGEHLPERITYADWLPKLATFCQEKDFSLFLLGGRPGVAANSASRLIDDNPALRIVGTQHGFFNKDPDHSENMAVLAEIRTADPDILVVSFGMPTQEKWLGANWDALNVSVGLTGGAAFDYTSGTLRRAPGWMTNHGLEWLGRLLIEPRRLWRRYLVGNPLFLFRVLRQRFRGRGNS